MQSRNKETIHRRSTVPLAVLTKARPHCNAAKTQNRHIQNSQSVSFSGTVLTRTITTSLITALISAGLVFWLMAPTAVAPHRWSRGTSGARSDPVLPSSGATVILSAPKKCPSQLPSVFTAAPHQTFIKCHLYSVWCEAISISQAVKWCLKRLLPGSVKKKTVQILT